jgi:hypothetical protein
MRKLILTLVASLGILALIGEFSDAKAQVFYGRRGPVVVNATVTPYGSSYTYVRPYAPVYVAPRVSYGVTVTPGFTNYYYSTPGYGYGVSYPNYSSYYSPYYGAPVNPYLYNPILYP